MARQLALLAFCLALSGFGSAQAGEPALVHEGIVAAPVADVWAAFTTRTGMESWMVAHAEIDLKVGGLMQTHYSAEGRIGDAGTIVNTVLSFDPQRMFSIKVARAPERFPFKNAIRSMWTVVYFEPAGDSRTRVTIRSMGFESDEESRRMRAFFDRGNAQTLAALQKRFAR